MIITNNKRCRKLYRSRHRLYCGSGVSLLKLHHRDTCTATVGVVVGSRGHLWYIAQILTHLVLECARALAVQNRNRANAYHHLRRTNPQDSTLTAETTFRQYEAIAADTLLTKGQRAEVLRNLGESLFSEEKYEAALNAFRESLLLNPDDKETKYDYVLTKRIVDQKRQQPQQENEQNENNDQQQNQDNKNDNQQNQGDNNQQQPENEEQDPEQQPQQPENEQGEGEDEQSLRGSSKKVADELKAEIQTKVEIAGLEILEAGEESRVLVTLREGKFHQVKRMFEAIGTKVTYLKRISMGPLSLGDLQPGEVRILTETELEQLKNR